MSAPPERPIRGAGSPPAILAVLRVRLRSRTAPGIHGWTTPDGPPIAPSALTRRALLAASGAMLALAGCGDDAEAPRASDERGGDSSLADVALLNDALAAERRAAPLLPRSAAHAAAIEREIERLGGEVQPLEAGGRAPRDARAARCRAA